MPSVAERRRNNIRAGLFVTTGLLLGLAVVFALTGLWQRFLEPTSPYQVDFSIANGVDYLQPGSDVRVGGLARGRVTSIETIGDETTPEAMTHIRVRFELSTGIQLYDAAQVTVESAIVGGESWLAITDVGDPTMGLMADGQVIKGVSSATLLATLLGSNAAANIEATVADARSFVGSLEAKYERDIRPTTDNVNAITADVRSVIEDFNTNRWPGWADRTDSVFTWADEVTGDIDLAISDGRELLGSAQAAIDDNRPHLDEIMANAESVSAKADLFADDALVVSDDVKEIIAHFQENTLAEVDAFIAKGQDGLDEVIALVETASADFDGYSVQIDETLGNATHISQQLKLAAVEIRRSPWRILYRPDNPEFEHEMLYNAARSFATAAADLKTSASAMRVILEKHGDLIGRDPDAFERLRRNLEDSLTNYERAQDRLFDELLDDQP